MLTSTERLVETNGVRLRVIEAGERGAPVVVLAHGFPELAYSWRHQIPVLAEAGYHVLAPDQRGYGGSSTARAPSTTTTSIALTGDLVGLLDDVGAERAVFVGHDWGAVVVWQARRCCTRTGSPVSSGLSVPPVPRPQVPTTQAFRRVFGDNFFYILYFQEPGAPTPSWPRPGHHDAPLMGSLTTTDEAAAQRMLQSGRRDSSTAFPSRAGCPTGSARTSSTTTSRSSPGPASPAPLNWYRNFDRNWELTATTPADAPSGAVAVHRRRRRPDAGLHAAPPCSRGGLRRLPRE